MYFLCPETLREIFWECFCPLIADIKWSKLYETSESKSISETKFLLGNCLQASHCLLMSLTASNKQCSTGGRLFGVLKSLWIAFIEFISHAICAPFCVDGTSVLLPLSEHREYAVGFCWFAHAHLPSICWLLLSNNTLLPFRRYLPSLNFCNLVGRVNRPLPSSSNDPRKTRQAQLSFWSQVRKSQVRKLFFVCLFIYLLISFYSLRYYIPTTVSPTSPFPYIFSSVSLQKRVPPPTRDINRTWHIILK